MRPPDEARRRARYHTKPAATETASSPTGTAILTDARSGRVVDLDAYRRPARYRLDWWPAWSVMWTWDEAGRSLGRWPT